MQCASTQRASRTWGSVPQHLRLGEDGNLYATTMDGRLWVFDPTNMAVPLAIFETPGQGAFLEGATSTGSGSPPPPAFYLSDFRTGVHRVQLQSIPGS